MARTDIKNNKQIEKVAKLWYAVQGSYQIIRITGHGSYFVRKLHKYVSPELKFIAYDLYPLHHLSNLVNLSTQQIHRIWISLTLLSLTPWKKPFISKSTMKNGSTILSKSPFHLSFINTVLWKHQLNFFLLFHPLLSFTTTLTLVFLHLKLRRSMILSHHLLLLLPCIHPSTKQIASFLFNIFLTTLLNPVGSLFKWIISKQWY